jgi:glycosyltransferase involved in cell wall biosynthesis
LKNADYVTSVSEDLLSAALTIHPFEKFKVINNSFEWSRIDETKTVANPCKGLVIGTSGIFRFKKGLPLLLKALEDVKFESEWSLLLVGDFLSKDEQSYHDYFFKRCSFKNQIYLTGMVNRNDVFSYLKHIDIFVAPSLFSEGCPTTVLEAMAMGLPIVGSDAGAIAEVLTHNETGLVYPQEDYTALTASIQKLVDDNHLRETLGKNALNYMERLNPQDEWHAWESVYTSCLQQQFS